jgi:hypothetical protein
VFVGGGMTRRDDWDLDRTCRGTGTWDIVERHLDMKAWRVAHLTIDRKYITKYRLYTFHFVYFLICAFQLAIFAVAEMLPYASIKRVEIQLILRILGYALIIA